MNNKKYCDINRVTKTKSHVFCAKCVEKGEPVMEFLDQKGASRLVSQYIEREIMESKRMTERELSGGSVAPAAKEAFNRKPYYSTGNTNLKCRPVLR